MNFAAHIRMPQKHGSHSQNASKSALENGQWSGINTFLTITKPLQIPAPCIYGAFSKIYSAMSVSLCCQLNRRT